MRARRTIKGGLAFQTMPFGAIETIPLPPTISMRIEDGATVSVNVGDQVLKGQKLTSGLTAAPAQHASTSGVVVEISDQFIAIETDGRDKASNTADDHLETPSELIEAFNQYGLVGLGGAAFPVATKINSSNSIANRQIDTLLINAAECDPAISCDEALMQERTEQIVNGIELAITATGAHHCIVGIEENKSLAIEQLKEYLPDSITLTRVPSIYPSGAEELLYNLCTGRTGTLTENNSLCFNIATCYSMYQAIHRSEPLISRIVTVVVGDEMRNFELRIGTPIKDLTAFLNLPAQYEIISGGLMVGHKVTTTHSISKQTNSLLFRTTKQHQTTACIRCGECADVCPRELFPQQLFWHTSPHDSAALHNLRLDYCIECGCCDAVCPSHIPLTQHFIDAKATIQQQLKEKQKADVAKSRFEARQQRLQDQNHRARQQLDKKSSDLGSSKQNEQYKKDLIAKALQRTSQKNQSANKP